MPDIQSIDRVCGDGDASFLFLPDSTNPATFWRSTRNSLFLELGVLGLLGSVNYEYLFTDFFGVRAGFVSDFETFTLVPICANFLLGAHTEHKCEVGIGISPLFSIYESTPVYHASLGYRYQSAVSGVIFRAAFTPLFGQATGYQVFPWGGVSIGYTW